MWTAATPSSGSAESCANARREFSSAEAGVCPPWPGEPRCRACAVRRADGGRPRADWRGSTDGSGHGFRRSSWAVRDSVIAIASGSGSRCEASAVTGLTLPRFRRPAGMTAATTAIPVTRFLVGEIRRRPQAREQLGRKIGEAVAIRVSALATRGWGPNQQMVDPISWSRLRADDSAGPHASPSCRFVVGFHETLARPCQRRHAPAIQDGLT